MLTASESSANAGAGDGTRADAGRISDVQSINAYPKSGLVLVDTQLERPNERLQQDCSARGTLQRCQSRFTQMGRVMNYSSAFVARLPDLVHFHFTSLFCIA